MNFNDSDIAIVAQCTPKGHGTIALIRISGINSLEVASKILDLKSKNIFMIKSHTVHFGKVIDKENNKVIDQVLAIFMRTPNSFTGQDIVEITCHNNQFIVDEIINLAIREGARYAREGEFSERAFLNGKIDLVQAEAINELIGAQTQIALKKSLAQVEGSFSNFIKDIEKELLETLGWTEASFEFAENLSNFDIKIQENLELVLKKIKDAKKSFDVAKQIRQGIRVAFIGTVNAGKSSLFNLLLRKDRAIITQVAGTTRDVIEDLLINSGNNLILIDTAGIRQSENLIEQKGIVKSLQEAHVADVILLIFDGARILTKEEFEIYKKIIEKYENKVILLQNKSDLEEKIENLDRFNKFLLKIGSSINIKKVSCHKNKEKIRKKIFDLINKKIELLFKNFDSPFLINSRQYKILLNIEKILKEAIEKSTQNEILAIYLNNALENMGELTGKTIKTKALDKIFKNFCIGK